MYQSLQILIFILWNFTSLTSGAVFATVGNNATFSAVLDPLPDNSTIISVQNPRNETVFDARGTQSKYTKDGQRMVFTGNTFEGEMSFVLKNILTEDAGTYTYQNTSIIFGSTTLFVLGIPSKLNIEVILQPIVNMNLVLNCEVESTTVPQNHNLSMTFNWKRNGVNVSTNSRYSINGSTLSIKNMQRNDEGMNITCTATEKRGLTSKTSDVFTVYPLYGPETVTFSPPTASYLLREQGTIPVITCTADCKPNCNYKWTKDGQVPSQDSGSTLSLRNIDRNDAGVYRCTAWNEYGTKNSSEINVDVKYGPGTVTFKPSTTNYSLAENATIPDITCTADCKPNCSYKWTKDGKVTSHGSGSTLSLKNINRYDTGVYRCTTWNEYSTKNSSEICVDIEYGPGAVTFRPSNTSYSITEQETIPDITCTAECNPNCSYKWNKDGQVTSHGSSSILSLININRYDAGVYRCEAWNGHGERNSSDINIDVKYGPGNVTFSPSNTSYSKEEEGTIPNITCSAECKPNCNYRWTKDRQVTSHGSGSTLSLKNVNRNDTGVYRCTAWNSHGTNNSDDIIVDIKYGPGDTVELQPSNPTYTFIENTTVSTNIKCYADCNPNCTYKWNSTKGSNPLMFGKIHRSQAGKYFCTAENEVGSTEVSVTIIVQYPSRIIGQVFNEIQVIEGQKTDIKCLIDAVPLPLAIWSKDNATFNIGSKPSNPSLFEIESANCDDTGKYKCTVDNHITNNSLDYRTFRLTVDCVPRLKFQHTYPKQVFVTTNEGLNISELIIAYPLPNVTWSFKNESIEDNSSITLIRTEDFEVSSHFSKNIMLENDFGIYTLVAENEFGKATASYNVTARRKPNVVTHFEVTCVSSTEANISFSPGFNGGSEQTFYVVYHKIGIQQTKTVSLNDTKQNMTSLISGLISQNEYVFKIISTNAFGNSSSDMEAKCRTKGQNKTGPPFAVIGGVTGSVVGLIVIGSIVLIVFFLRRRKDKTKGHNDGLRLRPVDSDEDQMKDNVLYEPAGPNYIRPGTSEAANGMNDYPYAEVQRSEGENLSNAKSVAEYSEVQKNQKVDKTKNVDPNAIYSHVNKPKKGFEGSVYENIDMKTSENKSKSPAAKKKGRKNKGRLQYADLVFAPSSSGKTFVIHGLEDRTNYVDIDFSKKAEPLPPEINETVVQSTDIYEKE